MQCEYRFPNIPELEHLRVYVWNQGKRLKTRIKGKCPPKLRILIKWYFEAYSWIHPIVRNASGNFYSLYLPPIPSPAHVRMFSSTISSLYFKRPLPLAVTIGVTTACQYRCIHCSATGRPSTKAVMTLQQIQKLVQECLDLGLSNITFTGGEPLLRSDLEECVASVPQGMATSQVFTNALELTEARAKSLKAAGLHGVQISLDHFSPEKHDKMRGYSGAFRAVRDGVKNALQVGLYVGLSTYSTKQSAMDHSLRNMADLSAEWGVHELTVFDAIPTGRLRNEHDQLLDAPARKALAIDSKAMNRKYRGKMRIVTQSWTNCGRGFAKIIGCLAAHMQFHVTAQGDLTPCDFTPLSIGDVTQQSVQEIWNALLHHPGYCYRSAKCRMQDPDFRDRYIHTIPEGSDLPYPIQRLPADP